MNFLQGPLRPISEDLFLPDMSKEDALGIKPKKHSINIWGWLPNEEKVIMSDSYDFGKLTLCIEKSSINLTGHYGA